MTNADMIRNLTNEELAETYVEKVKVNDPNAVYKHVYFAKHSSNMFCSREKALKAELNWLEQEVPE